MRRTMSVLAATLWLAPATALSQAAQPASSGEAVFARACASCHQAGQTAVPPPDALRAFSPEAIVNALVNGRMSTQGASLTPAERVAVAQFITGRAPMAAARRENRCTAATPTVDPMQGPRWMAWGGNTTNTRYASQGGLTAADVVELRAP